LSRISLAEVSVEPSAILPISFKVYPPTTDYNPLRDLYTFYEF